MYLFLQVGCHGVTIRLAQATLYAPLKCKDRVTCWFLSLQDLSFQVQHWLGRGNHHHLSQGETLRSVTNLPSVPENCSCSDQSAGGCQLWLAPWTAATYQNCSVFVSELLTKLAIKFREAVFLQPATKPILLSLSTQ